MLSITNRIANVLEKKDFHLLLLVFLLCFTMRASNFRVDRSVVILVAGALIKAEKYHEITEISPVRCKMIAGPLVCKVCAFRSLLNYESSLV